MNGFEKRERARAQVRERKRAAWNDTRLRFRELLEHNGAVLQPIVHVVNIPVDAGCERKFTWWRRDRLGEQEDFVRDGYSKQWLPPISFHGERIPPPGEAHTANMLMRAEAIGPEALDAALILAALRATKGSCQRWWHRSLEEYQCELRTETEAVLNEQGISTYTLSSVWFLPDVLRCDDDVDTTEKFVQSLATHFGRFLQTWCPVVVTLSDGVSGPHAVLDFSAGRTG